MLRFQPEKYLIAEPYLDRRSRAFQTICRRCNLIRNRWRCSSNAPLIVRRALRARQACELDARTLQHTLLEFFIVRLILRWACYPLSPSPLMLYVCEAQATRMLDCYVAHEPCTVQQLSSVCAAIVTSGFVKSLNADQRCCSKTYRYPGPAKPGRLDGRAADANYSRESVASGMAAEQRSRNR